MLEIGFDTASNIRPRRTVESKNKQPSATCVFIDRMIQKAAELVLDKGRKGSLEVSSNRVSFQESVSAGLQGHLSIVRGEEAGYMQNESQGIEAYEEMYDSKFIELVIDRLSAVRLETEGDHEVMRGMNLPGKIEFLDAVKMIFPQLAVELEETLKNKDEKKVFNPEEHSYSAEDTRYGFQIMENIVGRSPLGQDLHGLILEYKKATNEAEREQLDAEVHLENDLAGDLGANFRELAEIMEGYQGRTKEDPKKLLTELALEIVPLLEDTAYKFRVLELLLNEDSQVRRQEIVLLEERLFNDVDSVGSYVSERMRKELPGKAKELLKDAVAQQLPLLVGKLATRVGPFVVKWSIVATIIKKILGV